MYVGFATQPYENLRGIQLIKSAHAIRESHLMCCKHCGSDSIPLIERLEIKMRHQDTESLDYVSKFSLVPLKKLVHTR